MSAIATVIEALELGTDDIVLHGEGMYFCTQEHLRRLAARGVRTREVPLNSGAAVVDAIGAIDAERVVVLAEVVSNHPSMVALSVAEFSEQVQDERVVLIIDNTVLGAPLFSPRCLVDRPFDLFYIESLTKHYFLSESSLHSAGIARKGVDSSTRLGRHRWVVERTLAWLGQFRRLTIRYERRDDIHEAFLSLGCALICFRSVERYC